MENNFQELLQLASDGDVVAQEKLGTAYLKGNGVPKDIRKAVEYFQMAADSGSGLGNYQVGRFFETGTGLMLNVEKAIQYYEKSAALGYQNAENKLKMLKEKQYKKQNIENNYLNNSIQPPINKYSPVQPKGLYHNDKLHQEKISHQKSKLTAALFALFLGYFGVHNFYLGYTRKAVMQLILTLTFIGSMVSGIWAFVEFIMILSGSISVDAEGISLR